MSIVLNLILNPLYSGVKSVSEASLTPSGIQYCAKSSLHVVYMLSSVGTAIPNIRLHLKCICNFVEVKVLCRSQLMENLVDSIVLLQKKNKNVNISIFKGFQNSYFYIFHFLFSIQSFHFHL